MSVGLVVVLTAVVLVAALALTAIGHLFPAAGLCVALLVGIAVYFRYRPPPPPSDGGDPSAIAGVIGSDGGDA